jgi:hypothetical protein
MSKSLGNLRISSSNNATVTVTNAGSVKSEMSDFDKQFVAKSEPSMEGVMEKIRKQQGGKQDWSEDKIRKLTNYSNH